MTLSLALLFGQWNSRSGLFNGTKLGNALALTVGQPRAGLQYLELLLGRPALATGLAMFGFETTEGAEFHAVEG